MTRQRKNFLHVRGKGDLDRLVPIIEPSVWRRLERFVRGRPTVWTASRTKGLDPLTMIWRIVTAGIEGLRPRPGALLVVGCDGIEDEQVDPAQAPDEL